MTRWVFGAANSPDRELARTFDPQPRPELRVLNGLDAVFTPERVALVGASERAGTVGRLLWQNLATFPGEVLPISRGPTVFGRTAYPDLLTAPGDIDLAIVAVPAKRRAAGHS